MLPGKISAEDFARSAWLGPQWTPYAQTVANNYSVQVPWYLTLPTNLTGTNYEQVTVVTDPNQYDVLILGALINIGDDANGDNGQQVYLQITDLETGISWSAPNLLNYSPATAYGGVANQVTPVMRLPEAFFLPRKSRLKLDWTNSTSNFTAAIGGSITLVGVQLSGAEAPENITLPDGNIIGIRSRMPWFASIAIGAIGLGIVINNQLTFGFPPGTRFLQYAPPSDCNVEIHDIICNFLLQSGVDVQSDMISVKISDAGQKGMWTPNPSFIGAAFGDYRKANPAQPLPKPYLLKQGHRIQLMTLNAGITTLQESIVTLRGVRLCKY
jgi:hypothetical protein